MAEAALAITRDTRAANGTTGTPVTDWELVAHELGRDHARHGVTPPPEHLTPGHPLREGWQQARRVRSGRSSAPRFTEQHGRSTRTEAVQDWLSLRLDAWLRGVPVQHLTVTPNLLRQLQVSHCPVTREPLHRSCSNRHPSHPTITRLHETAAYAAGHLAVLSQRATQALEGSSFDQLAQHARTPPAGTLTPLQWARLAVLRAFATPLPHAQAAALPLLVLPPNRVRVRNPIQALQVLLTLLLAKSGWSKHLPAWQALMPDAAARRELQAFFLCLVAKAVATKALAGRHGDAQAHRWALEDAWRHPQVLAHWKRFALRLDEASAQSIVDRALAAGLVPQQVQGLTDEQATDGWSVTEAQATLPAAAAAPQLTSTRLPTPTRAVGLAAQRCATTPLQLALLVDE